MPIGFMPIAPNGIIPPMTSVSVQPLVTPWLSLMTTKGTAKADAGIDAEATAEVASLPGKHKAGFKKTEGEAEVTYHDVSASSCSLFSGE